MPPRCGCTDETTAAATRRANHRPCRRPLSNAGPASPAPAPQSGRDPVEAEVLPQPALDEPPVAGLQESGGEQHERRRPGCRPGWRTAPAAACRRAPAAGSRRSARRATGSAGRSGCACPRSPARSRIAGASWCTARPVCAEMLTRARPGHPAQIALELALDLLAAVGVDQVRLVHRDHQCPAGVDHHDQTRWSCSVIGSTRRSARSRPRPPPSRSGCAARRRTPCPWPG